MPSACALCPMSCILKLTHTHTLTYAHAHTHTHTHTLLPLLVPSTTPKIDFSPTMKVEYTDGSIFETSTVKHTAADLRAVFYENAENAEEAISSKQAAGGGSGATASKGNKKR